MNKDIFTKLAWVLVALVILTIWAIVIVSAKTVGERSPMLGPDENDYYATLMQPDNPGMSCCGAADVYWADEQEVGPNGQIIAIITDGRPDTRVLPDGRQLQRSHVAVGTKVPIPPSKLRKKAIPNPTDHTLVFLGPGGVYCYEPQALL